VAAPGIKKKEKEPLSVKKKCQLKNKDE